MEIFTSSWSEIRGKKHKANSVERTNYKNVHFGALFIILLSEYPNVMSGRHLQHSLISQVPEQQPAGCSHVTHIPAVFLFASYPLFYRNKECQKKKRKRKIQVILLLTKLIPPSCYSGLNLPVLFLLPHPWWHCSPSLPPTPDSVLLPGSHPHRVI